MTKTPPATIADRHTAKARELIEAWQSSQTMSGQEFEASIGAAMREAAAEEREACARLAHRGVWPSDMPEPYESGFRTGYDAGLLEVQTAIRARGETDRK